MSESDIPETLDGAAPAEDLNETLARLEAEVAEWREAALRAAAETENTRRRAEREANDARAYAIQRFARDLLGVADNLQRALQAAPEGGSDPAVEGLVTGLKMTEKSLLAAFEGNGLTRVAPAAGERFDPNVHQAMMEQLSESQAPGAVIDTLQPGYVLFGRVVRPAMVVVASKGSGTAATEPSGGYGAETDDGWGGELDTRA